MRVGHGFDVHALVAGRKCIIGGVEIAYNKGLDGHSDADVLLHAICDALLGAVRWAILVNISHLRRTLTKMQILACFCAM